ncbi:uncharacterized protein LOC122659798 [Telopea speciosissima]|uniref:uncharacterized protein LOC122659798 n=1 Tax=Telopea speciosissima TaxID=54955 RepID=UPI001CC3C4D0|nr:uncharacterized protein LOC122659798 [Telopea speciosissima]XP_043710869.1 uncharacterized protein LOC122659798 [Telopea speciosissima]
MCWLAMGLRERDLLVDLESGGTTSVEANKEPSAGVKQTKKLLGRVLNGVVNFDGAIKGEDGTSLVNTSSSADVCPENPEMLTDKKSSEEEPLVLGEKKVVKEKRKKTSAKPPKPPRPPRGPSLDAADMKLVREISELAMLKRARIERMKALKKMKAAKATSPSGSLCAMVITILFCLVIIFQGICSKSSSAVSFQGSPESAVGLISIQFNKNLSTSDANGISARSPNFMDQVAGSNSR